MGKQLCVFLVLFPVILAACTSSPTVDVVEPEPLPFLSSLPSRENLVFVGIIGIRSNPKETLRLALEDAARKVAIFNQVSGEYFTEINVGSGAFDYTHNVVTNLSYDEESAKNYIDALKYDSNTDAMEIEGTFIIRTSYPASLPYPVSYRPEYSGADKKPDWVDNPPLQISGYEIGIGYAGRHSTITEACSASYKNAIFSILRNLTVTARGGDLLFNSLGAFDYKTENNNAFYARGALRDFYVLDTWINPKDKSVWTLAIAEPIK
jgi:hypothetical protein